MIILKGKYNVAKVMLPDDTEQIYEEINGNKFPLGRRYKYLDLATQDQIQQFLNHPACAGRTMAIMPDTHYGKGSCVGFTFPMEETSPVIPNMVGVDIGCGIYSVKVGNANLLGKIEFADLDKFIRNSVPAGFSVHVNRNERELLDLAQRFDEHLLDDIEFVSYDIDNLGGLSRFQESLGTLGGGNHFLELGEDEAGDMWLTVHSGSRNFGLQVANYFQQKARKQLQDFFIDRDLYKDSEFLPAGYGKDEYLEDMYIAQRYAHVNRMMMLQKIVEGFFHQTLLEENVWQSVHNYINPYDNIIRKGAVSAYEGERVVIPFNMEDGLILGYGKGNAEWNFSAPHGAGRILSRNKAKEVLSLDEAKRGMEKAGIFTTSLSVETLDEAKGAYKSKDLILEMIKDTVDVVNFVKPVYNFKAK